MTLKTTLELEAFASKHTNIEVIYAKEIALTQTLNVMNKGTALWKLCLIFALGFLALEYSGHGKSSGKFTNGNITKWSNEVKIIIKWIICWVYRCVVPTIIILISISYLANPRQHKIIFYIT